MDFELAFELSRFTSLNFLSISSLIVLVHAFTKDPEEIIDKADIEISAARVANLARKHWLKCGSVVIDVGTNLVKTKAGSMAITSLEMYAMKKHCRWFQLSLLCLAGLAPLQLLCSSLTLLILPKMYTDYTELYCLAFMPTVYDRIYQIVIAIKKEVEDLEAAGVTCHKTRKLLGRIICTMEAKHP